MEALPQAATRSDDAIDEEKADGATLLPSFMVRSDDDRAEEKPAVKSAAAATPGPVKKAQLLNAAKSAGLDDETSQTSQRLWTALLARRVFRCSAETCERGVITKLLERHRCGRGKSGVSPPSLLSHELLLVHR